MEKQTERWTGRKRLSERRNASERVIDERERERKTNRQTYIHRETETEIDRDREIQRDSSESNQLCKIAFH